MGDSATPSRDDCGGSLHGSNYNLGRLPPLNSFSGTVDEQIQKAKEWRQRHKSQQPDPAGLPAQQTPSRNAPYLATATSANISPVNASQRASWYNPPPRSNHQYQNHYENPAQRQSHPFPSRHAPYNLSQSSPSSSAPYHPSPVSAPPYHPHHQHNHHQTGPSGAVGFTPAPATLWQSNPAQFHPPSYNQAQPHAPQLIATGHHQYNNQPIDPAYRQPQAAPSNSYHLDQRYRAPLNLYGPQSRCVSQPTAPGYSQRCKYPAQATDPQDQQHGYPAQAITPEYPPRYGYLAQPAATEYPCQHGYTAQPNPYGCQPQAAQLNQGHYYQRPAAIPSTPNQSRDASTAHLPPSPGQQQAICGRLGAGSDLRTEPQSLSIAPISDHRTVAAFAQTTNFSEDEDWEAFEAEVVDKAPTVSSAAAVARNFNKLSLASSAASLLTAPKSTSHLLFESSSTETPTSDSCQPNAPGPVDCALDSPASVQTFAGASAQSVSDQLGPDQPAKPELRPSAKNWRKALRTNLAIETAIDGFPLGLLQYTTVDEGDKMNQDKGKRKASEEPESPAAVKRVKHAESAAPESKPKMPLIPFPEKPAVIEERNGEIEFQVVNNDGSHNSFIILTHLKCIFQKQLPKMPKDYIARLVYDRTHLSIAIVKHPLEVVGGITFRPFKDRKFAEIVFCAISSDQQVKGYGAHLMAHLKDFVQSSSPVMHFLTYADNYAIGYFKKQGFTKEITLEKSVWMGYIKDYEGGTIMQCTMLPRVRYLENGRMLLKQRETVDAKIRATSNSHIVHQPPKQWKNGVVPIDPMSIPAIRNAGWSPEMDELARQPRRGANYNQLLHLLNSMQNHQSAWPFLVPVNRDEVQDYYEVIKEPMDLSTMEQKLEADKYPNPEDFLKDAMLIFKNCRQYNSEGTPYTKMANKLEKYVWTKVREIPEWSHLEEELATKK